MEDQRTTALPERDGGSNASASSGGGESQGTSGADAAISPPMDASIAPSDASLPPDAGASAQCDCVGETITWFFTGGLGAARMNRVTPSCEFSHTEGLDWEEPMCSTQADPCDAAAINEALQLPGVQAALAEAPVFYGANASSVDISYLRIDIGGQVIDVGEPCPLGSDCVIPDDIEALRFALEELANRQLVRAPCREKFTDNEEDCDQRKQSEQRVSSYESGGECNSAADCDVVDLSTGCTDRCPIVRSHPFALWLKRVRAFADSQSCDGYKTDCGPVPAATCAPITPACVDGECVAQ